MLVEEELRAFVMLYQRKENLNLEKLKKSFLFMDENLVEYMRLFILEISNSSDSMDEQSLSIVDYEKLKQQVPRLLTRVNTLFLEIHMIPIMKEIETNCNLLI